MSNWVHVNSLGGIIFNASFQICVKSIPLWLFCVSLCGFYHPASFFHDIRSKEFLWHLLSPLSSATSRKRYQPVLQEPIHQTTASKSRSELKNHVGPKGFTWKDTWRWTKRNILYWVAMLVLVAITQKGRQRKWKKHRLAEIRAFETNLYTELTQRSRKTVFPSGLKILVMTNCIFRGNMLQYFYFILLSVLTKNCLPVISIYTCSSKSWNEFLLCMPALFILKYILFICAWFSQDKLSVISLRETNLPRIDHESARSRCITKAWSIVRRQGGKPKKVSTCNILHISAV